MKSSTKNLILAVLIAFLLLAVAAGALFAGFAYYSTSRTIPADILLDVAADTNLDNCLITNMAAVHVLKEDLTRFEDRLARMKMTEDAYQSIQLSLAADRETIASLLALREEMLRDDALDDSDQAARNAGLMRTYANGANAAIAEARENETPAEDLAAKATSCAKGLAQ